MSSSQPLQTYQMIKLLGEGSYGKAYLVKSNLDQTKCVIKTIKIEEMNEKERKETLCESTILQKLDHPNIIKFKEVFMAKKPFFTLNIVTEYADGGDLHQKIKNRKGKLFPENQILDWFTQIALAINHIHNKFIIHRDLKPQNIFMTKTGLIKLGDFGIAKCLENSLQKAKTCIGTPYYLSPEILLEKPYSFKSDIWSLGVLLYEMITLKVPFEANSLPLLSLKIVKGVYNQIPKSFSNEIKDLVKALLQVNPNKRPSIKDLLKYPIIKNRIQNFLEEVGYDQDFSQTFVKAFGKIKEKKQIILVKKKIEKKEGKKKNVTRSSNNVVHINLLNEQTKFQQQQNLSDKETKSETSNSKNYSNITTTTEKTSAPYENFKEFIKRKKNEVLEEEKNNAIFTFKDLINKNNDKSTKQSYSKIPKIILTRDNQIISKKSLSRSIVIKNKDNKKENDKDEIELNNNDDFYNANRYLNLISQVISNKEASEISIDVDENASNTIIKEGQSEKEVDNINKQKEKLQSLLGYNLFQSIYTFVDVKTDPRLYSLSVEEIKELLKTQMTKLEYSEKTIELSVSIIPNILSILSIERGNKFLK